MSSARELLGWKGEYQNVYLMTELIFSHAYCNILKLLFFTHFLYYGGDFLVDGWTFFKFLSSSYWQLSATFPSEVTCREIL